MKKERLLSLDAFRGITMASMLIVENPGNWSIYPPFRHASWGYPNAEGLPMHEHITPTDFILPFFIFIMGLAVVFALSSKKEKLENHGAIIKKVVIRSLSLYGIGLAFYALPSLLGHMLYGSNFGLQMTGVLQMLAITYLLSSILFLKLSRQSLIRICIAFPFLMMLLTLFVPIPGFGDPVLLRQWHEPAHIPKNLHSWVDTLIFGYGSPDGLLTSLSASITALLGVLTGLLIKDKKVDKTTQTVWIFAIGTLLAAIGWIWGQFFPIIKDLWTGPYTYLTGGLAMMSFALCYWFIDIQGKKKWTKPFVAYGMNCLAVYIASHLVGSTLRIVKVSQDTSIHDWIMQHCFESWMNAFNASLAFSFATAIFWLLPLLYLYKKKIYIKV